jgi:drug/metabolite transporter (DMT)-like permease
MAPLNLLGVLSALASAAVWGSGDFAGGFAARRSSQYQVVVLAALSGLVALVPLAIVRGEPVPPAASVAWASGAGVAGALGMIALYLGLSKGRVAVVAPTAGVVGAALPVVVGSVLEGVPGALRLAGMGLGIAGIWLVSGGLAGERDVRSRDVWVGVVAGVGFGGFFVLIAQVQAGLLFSPLVVAKLAAIAAALVMLRREGHALPGLGSNPIALLAGVLDAGGNVLYLLARQFTRLDIAAVLSSMYPAATVLLARAILREAVSRRQWAGVGLCLAGVALIAV